MRRGHPAVVLCGALLLAGCLTDPSVPPLDSTLDRFHSRPTEYHWPPLLATDDAGSPMPLEGNDWPDFVEATLPEEGSNPTLAINSKGHLFVSTFDRLQASTDEGRSWRTVYNYTSPRYPTAADTYSTQAAGVFIDPTTDRLFVAHRAGGGSCGYIGTSDDGGQTWQERGRAPDPVCLTRVDTNLVIAPPAPDQKVAFPASSYPNIVYSCGPNEWNSQFCSASYDSGDTFVNLGIVNEDIDRRCQVVDWLLYHTVEYAKAVLDHAVHNQTLQGNPATKPFRPGRAAAYADGTLVLPIGDSRAMGCPLMVAVSADNGFTWTFRMMPPRPFGYSVERFTQIAITPDNTAYLAYRSNDSFVYLVRSKDQFKTWEGPFRVTPQGQTINRMVSIVAGSDGRIAVSWLGTRTFQDKQSYWLNADSRWHVFIATSLDAAAEHPHFVTQQVTPEEDPIQIGCVKGANPDPRSSERECQNLLNWLSASRNAEGRVYVALTDGCSARNDCMRDTNSGFQARDREVALAVMDSGTSLLADKGVLPSLGISHPRPVPRT